MLTETREGDLARRVEKMGCSCGLEAAPRGAGREWARARPRGAGRLLRGPHIRSVGSGSGMGSAQFNDLVRAEFKMLSEKRRR